MTGGVVNGISISALRARTIKTTPPHHAQPLCVYQWCLPRNDTRAAWHSVTRILPPLTRTSTSSSERMRDIKRQPYRGIAHR